MLNQDGVHYNHYLLNISMFIYMYIMKLAFAVYKCITKSTCV